MTSTHDLYRQVIVQRYLLMENITQFVNNV